MKDHNKDGEAVVQEVRRADGVAFVALAGDVDLHRTVELRGCLLEIIQEKPKMTIVNMEKVEFMDSSGVATLIEALQLSRRNGGKLKLVGMQRRVRSIFEISRLESIFEIYETESEALA